MTAGEYSPETIALAQKIQDLCLKAIDDITAEIAREKLVGGPCCKDIAVHPGEYRLATIRWHSHGCDTGLQCEDCAEAGRQRFTTVVDALGYATCTKCGQRFTDYGMFATWEKA
ncbi:hypothetical protein [Nocardia africana]